MGRRITYTDNFQKAYRYELTARPGRDFHAGFTPDLTPAEMLRVGVFGGAYFIGVPGLLPSDVPKRWFRRVALSSDGKKHAAGNFFGVRASLPLAYWKTKGWIHPADPHGWFQWYCRYYLGRRLPREDERQIMRWRAMRRHVAQVQRNCRRGDATCRPKQRQALLHWAYDSRLF